jgi:poly-gamma-glutamate synthesis protein (capsule biosynthesis protein)
MKLMLVGDVMLGRLINDILRHESPEYPWGDTLPILKNADWRVCNLECAISDRGTPWSRTSKTFHFRSDARNIAVLQAARINAVSLANNHTLDFDHEAMFDMLGLLDRAGIAHSGAGPNLAKRRAWRSARSRCQNRLLSFTDNQPEWEAGPNQPGVFYVPVEWEDERTKTSWKVFTPPATVDLLCGAHWGQTGVTSRRRNMWCWRGN